MFLFYSCCAFWLYKEIRMIRYINYGNTDDFALSDKEEKEINLLKSKYQSQKKIKSSIDSTISKIAHQGRNLSKNKDGTYSRRSTLGKQLNIVLSNALTSKKTIYSMYYQLNKDIIYISELPKTRARRWSELASKRSSARLSITILSILILISGSHDWAVILMEIIGIAIIYYIFIEIFNKIYLKKILI